MLLHVKGDKWGHIDFEFYCLIRREKKDISRRQRAHSLGKLKLKVHELLIRKRGACGLSDRKSCVLREGRRCLGRPPTPCHPRAINVNDLIHKTNRPSRKLRERNSKRINANQPLCYCVQCSRIVRWTPVARGRRRVRLLFFFCTFRLRKLKRNNSGSKEWRGKRHFSEGHNRTPINVNFITRF